MAQHLVLTLRLHEDGLGWARYHGMSQGAPEWPPAPARVYQALVAGVARGRALPASAVHALEWLEALPPPVIAAPQRTPGQAVALFVPNNDADALTDPRDVSGIRTAKLVQPSLFAANQPLLYVWSLESGGEHAATIVDAANDLYQLGRGIDMAWAVAEVLDDAALDACLAAHRGIIHRPEPGVRGTRMLACPAAGSLGSLVQRHQAIKLRTEGVGKKMRVLFTNPPKPRFASVSYERARRLAVYELRDRDAPKPWPWALGRSVKLVETLRDAAANKLQAGLGGDADLVERSLVGRAADGSGAVPVTQRIRIIPLPSIGSVHADRAIRRVLVDVPSGAPLPAADVEWAFSGLARVDSLTGELSPWVLAQSEGDDMLRYYVGPSRRWRSVTAVALPESAQRRRIDPARRQQEAKPASERIAEEGRAVAAVRAALRHAGVGATVVSVRVQREPFEAKGARAEVFAESTRFAKERLWHVELEFDRDVEGPLVIGDGRFVGLGVMAPAQASAATSGIYAFGITDGIAAHLPALLARALRRAVMARVRDALGLSPDAGLDRFFSGHERDGAKAAAEVHGHLAYHWDAPRQRLLLIAPHRLARRASYREERQHLQTLERAIGGLTHLTAGAAGALNLRRQSLADDDPLLASARRWTSVTPYVVTRHRRCGSAHEALVADVLAECERQGLPRPKVSVVDLQAIQGNGLQGRLRLDFPVAVTGPIALGRSARLGGGLFSAVQNPDNPAHGLEDGLEERDPRMAPVAPGGAVGAPPRARGGSDLAEHGVRARDGRSELAESDARSATQPADATRHFDTGQGRLSYSELARRLAEPLLRIDDRIRSGEFAERAMDADLLLALHGALCTQLFPEQAGRYRTVAVQVGAHEAPLPHQVAARILEYGRNLGARLQHLPAEPDDRWLEALAYAEGELLSIHPFPDLNGRVTRLWLLELLRRMGLPPVDIVPSDADFRQRYLDALAAADRRDWQPLQALWRERLERAGEQP
jgi:CRISPR-associated protein Csb2